MTVDHHVLAVLALMGSSIDVLGALYLAYDLLGGEHGPLRTLTRGVTYALVFGAGFGLAMGPVFGIVTGAAHGLTLAWEFGRASRGEFDTRVWRDVTASGLRALGFAIGASWLFGTIFGVTFGLLSWVGQAIAYRFNVRPTLDYIPVCVYGSRQSSYWLRSTEPLGTEPPAIFARLFLISTQEVPWSRFRPD